MKSYWPALRVGGLFLMSATLVPFLAEAQTSTPATTPVSAATAVAHVEVAQSGQRTVVRVQGSGGRLSYHVSRLDNPPRVVVDFDDARLSVGRNAIPSEYQPVRGVRLGQARADQVRMVIDLMHPAAFSVDDSSQGLIVTFGEPVAGKSPAAANAKLTEASINGPAFPLPATLTGRTASLASPAPQAQAPQADQVPQIPQAVPAVASGPIAALGAMTQQPAVPAGRPAAVYSGEPISVNFRDIDLRDFFRLIKEISGLNVVLDPTVHGTVTLVLDDVPWDQAMDIVLKNNGLSKELDGNVLRIVTKDTLKKEATDARDLVKAQTDAIDLVMVTRVLSYAKASDLIAPLKPFLSSRGTIMSMASSNTLIIRDIPGSVPQIDNLIRQLDRKTQQVEIQARVVQASRTFLRDIGSQFGFAGITSTANSSNVLGGPPTPTFASPIVHSQAPPLVDGGTSIPLVSNFPANAPTSGFSFSHSSPNFALDYIITAMESKGVGKLLSSPETTALNNTQAEIKQGEEIPIQTTVNNTVSVQYVDAVLRLLVTPQITADGTVLMDVVVENTQVDSGVPLVQGIPALSTQSAKTKMLVADGGTVQIGGVMVSQQQTTIDQMPLLGSVPLIGHLFKHTEVNVSSQELLFFITPRILPG